MKFIHRIKARFLLHRAKHQHRKLERFIHESARDICVWRKEIAWLEADARQELALAGLGEPPAIATEPLSDKVVPIDQKAA